MNQINPKNFVWTEKFRPRKVSEIVGDFKGKILKYLENPEKIPNFLLYSRCPGTGKTSLCKAIVNELGCDSLILNSSDDRKIETVREKVKEFSMTKSSKQGLKRCVIMDEADGMMKISQDALRNVMETYSSNVFFILTANNVNKIIDPLKSRCITIPFAYPNKEEIYKYLIGICEKEKLKYSKEGVIELVERNYPSIRDCVLKLQDLHTEEKEITVKNVSAVNDLFVEMWKCVKEKKWQEIKEVVLKSTIDPRELNTYFWMQFLKENNIKGIQICCRNEKDIAVGSDAKIIMVTSLIEMVK